MASIAWLPAAQIYLLLLTHQGCAIEEQAVAMGSDYYCFALLAQHRHLP